MLSRVIVNYDTKRFPFASIMAEHLGVADLAELHRVHDLPFLTRYTDQGTELHRHMYKIGDSFHAAYLDFLGGFVRDLIGQEIVYQRIPNFRVQVPGNVGVGYFHRDRDNNHSEFEINFWVPLTHTSSDNTLWIESVPGRCDYQPVILRYGQMLVFDGANLMHGNKISCDQRTRVSFDFRVMPDSLYQDNHRKTVVMKSRLVVGDYWARFSRPDDSAEPS